MWILSNKNHINEVSAARFSKIGKCPTLGLITIVISPRSHCIFKWLTPLYSLVIISQTLLIPSSRASSLLALGVHLLSVVTKIIKLNLCDFHASIIKTPVSTPYIFNEISEVVIWSSLSKKIIQFIIIYVLLSFFCDKYIIYRKCKYF